MRAFELRVYTLRIKEALDFYREAVYRRHLNSIPLFGIEAHGLWTASLVGTPEITCAPADARR